MVPKFKVWYTGTRAEANEQENTEMDNRYFARIARQNAAIATANGEMGVAFRLNLEADELEKRADRIDAIVAESWKLTLEAVEQNRIQNGPFSIYKK